MNAMDIVYCLNNTDILGTVIQKGTIKPYQEF